MYQPNDKQTLFQLANTLLHDFQCHITDTILETSDGNKVPACRKLLALKSEYFNSITNSTEALILQVPINLYAVRETLFFCYTGHSPLVENIAQNKLNAIVSKESISNLVSVAAAASRLKVRDLHQWSVDVLVDIVNEQPEACCLLLETLIPYEEFLPNAIPSILELIVRKPRSCLRVPDIVIPVDGIVFTDHSGRYEYGVLDLSSKAMGRVIAAFSNGNDEEYLFQVLYFWATKGTLLPCSCCIADDVVECERWEQAKYMAKLLDLKKMRVRFLRDYVAPTGLLDVQVLCAAFTQHAIENAAPIRNVRHEQ